MSNKPFRDKPGSFPNFWAEKAIRTPPVVNGVSPSCITLRKGPWRTVLAFLEEYFPHISSQEWLSRINRGKIIDQHGIAVNERTLYRAGMQVFYYRELEKEVPIPFEEHIIHKSGHLIVADKPHFLPVMPSGPYLNETLLVRLKKKLAMDDIVPIHRIDKDTSGIVVFSCNRNTRALYAALFRERRVQKAYEAIAPILPHATFPFVHKSRIVRGEPFFRMKETEGMPNSETSINAKKIYGQTALYTLVPITGKKHQLRLHMSSLGIPIKNDRLYPHVMYGAPDDFTQPLQLIARSVSFVDPLTGEKCSFVSDRTLDFHSDNR